MIPLNESVKILCQGTPQSFLYQLEILGNSTNKMVEEKYGFQKEAEFIINHMDTKTAGRYQCRYRKAYRWSKYSEALQLVVTGEGAFRVFFFLVFFIDNIFRAVSDLQGN